jgi:hypothetical protein
MQCQGRVPSCRRRSGDGTSLEASLARTGLPALLILAQSRTLLSRVWFVGWINPDGFQGSWWCLGALTLGAGLKPGFARCGLFADRGSRGVGSRTVRPGRAVVASRVRAREGSGGAAS